MNLWTKARLAAHTLRWVLTWKRHNLDSRPRQVASPKFMSAREAALLVPDGATVFSSGMAGNQRNSIFFWAIRDRFERSGTPKQLTWITVGAQGGRGRVPGTVETLAAPGLLRLQIGGHLETHKALLRLADKGELELHTMPQGVEALIVEAMGAGEDSILTDVGVGTFLDPRHGRGTPVLAGASESFVAAEGDKLRYRLPRFDVSMFAAPAADAEGNIYMDRACMLTETREATRATKKNGGRVLVTVAEIVPKRERDIFVPASEVDAVVVNPYNEQATSFRQLEHLRDVTAGAEIDVVESAQRLRFINDILGLTPRRGPTEMALARLAAWVFTRNAHARAVVNVGVGLPEEVARAMVAADLTRDLTFTTEVGVFGGLPVPGIFFGAAIAPKKLITSAEMFHLFERQLDVAILGLLEADGEGNVNVSKRGEGATNYVGPGGFPDISRHAHTLIFVGTWMAGAKLALTGDKLRVVQAGAHKFLPRVREVTFSGREAMRRGQNVLYVTNVGVFRLTQRGMELTAVVPGVDIRRDILEACPMKVVAPSSDVPIVPSSIMTGCGFAPSFVAADQQATKLAEAH